ncbi:uncharacterized protein C8R40DRAFT_571744 [Lentinula edodes]|uniref:uncharacterized protein n=1 Tax=Lentinula edodes TaxID=5353 RepID=UPI001E8E27BE|nr:uncharacterized protein C8R40DRAFT_571744 [Lentinula edodes]KAH7871187.1 hypothetical protein C8R40DRAFT_571744 [Lentinula edodes]
MKYLFLLLPTIPPKLSSISFTVYTMLYLLLANNASLAICICTVLDARYETHTNKSKLTAQKIFYQTLNQVSLWLLAR